MTVALPSEPANYFHLLRRHAADRISRPLVVFTPKSMLRNRAVVSPVEDFTTGQFREVIDDPRFRSDRSGADASTPRSARSNRPAPDQDGPATGFRRLLLCSGKIYWELAATRDSRGLDEVAIVRIEQLYPLPDRQLAAVLDRYPNATDVRWVQEEPANQGPWPYFGLELPEKLPPPLGAEAGVAPADGRARAELVKSPRCRAEGDPRPGSESGRGLTPSIHRPGGLPTGPEATDCTDRPYGPR
jgi:2-oxoglutarate decarboxylase